MVCCARFAKMESILDDLFGDEGAETIFASAADVQEQQTVLPFAEVRSVSAVNARIYGGRGVVACRDIAPGTLIVAEVPILQWAADSMDDASYLVDVISTIVRNDEVHAVTKDLHPVRYADAEEADVAMATATLTSRGKLSLADMARNLDGSAVDEHELVRLFLVLQHNGFGSGLYRHLTKFNHSCLPNCIKFGSSSSIHNASEVWSTTLVKKNEELTISYINPIEQSSNAIQAYLLQNHRFTCACVRCSGASSTNDVALIDEERLQENLEMAERELELMKLDDEADVVAHCYQLLKKSRKLILLACGGSGNGNGVGVYVRSRILKVAVQCSSLLLEAAGAVRGQGGRRAKEKVVLTAATGYLQYSLLLLEQQRNYLGDDHIDLAQTYFDLADAVRCLQASFPGALAQLPGTPAWAASDTEARAAAAAYRQQGARLKNLFLASRHGDALRRALRRPGDVFWGGF